MLPWPLAETYTKLGREMLHTLISELGCGHPRGLQLDGQESLPGSDHQGSPAKGKKKVKAGWRPRPTVWTDNHLSKHLELAWRQRQ